MHLFNGDITEESNCLICHYFFLHRVRKHRCNVRNEYWSQPQCRLFSGWKSQAGEQKQTMTHVMNSYIDNCTQESCHLHPIMTSDDNGRKGILFNLSGNELCHQGSTLHNQEDTANIPHMACLSKSMSRVTDGRQLWLGR